MTRFLKKKEEWDKFYLTLKNYDNYGKIYKK